MSLGCPTSKDIYFVSSTSFTPEPSPTPRHVWDVHGLAHGDDASSDHGSTDSSDGHGTSSSGDSHSDEEPTLLAFDCEDVPSTVTLKEGSYLSNFFTREYASSDTVNTLYLFHHHRRSIIIVLGMENLYEFTMDLPSFPNSH